MEDPASTFESSASTQPGLREKLAFARSFLVVLRETRLFDPLIDKAISDLDAAADESEREV